MKKKLIFGIIFLISIISLCSSFTLVKECYVESSYNIPENIKSQIKVETQGMEDIRIAKYCVKLTAKMLDFSEVNNISKSKANCVGYATVCTALCNYAYNVNSINIKVKHVRGKVLYSNLDICNILKNIVPSKYKNFVKNHDFIELDVGNKYIFLDPTSFDIVGNYNMTISTYKFSEKKKI